MKTDLDIALVAASLVLKKDNMKLSYDLLTCSHPTHIITVTNKYLKTEDISEDARELLKLLKTMAENEIIQFNSLRG